MDYYSSFWCTEAISIVVEPRGVLTSWSSTLAVLADSGTFLGLSLCFLGPGVISMIDEYSGAFMCRSSTLTILADSGPFHVLLLTILESQSDFHD